MFTPSSTSLEKLISIGGGVIISCTSYPSITIERFAAISSRSGAKIIVKNASQLTSLSMERIAAIGKGNIIFDFTE